MTSVKPNNRLRHKFIDCPVKYINKVTTLKMGTIKVKTDFLCFLSETSKLVYEPFRDLRYNLSIKGRKNPPIMMDEVMNAFLKSSKVNVANSTNRGKVNKGCPAIDII